MLQIGVRYLWVTWWPNVDIVPVSRVVDGNQNVSHYSVPDANTSRWIESNPKTHAANIDTKAALCGANFRRIIKMMKWWNLHHSDYLQSYHIEVLAHNVFSGSLDDMPWQVLKFFDSARTFLAQPLSYDRGFADDYLSAGDRNEVMKRFNTAYNTSLSAWHSTYGTNDDHAKAIGLWRQIFGDKFPTYG